MKTLFSGLATSLGAIALALAAPAAAQGSDAAARAPAAATADADPALWVIKDADTTIYLFGTVHILKPGLSWFDEAVADAFAQSDELVTELPKVDDTAMAQMMMTVGTDPSGVTLRSRLSADQVKAYEAAMAKLGMPPELFDKLEPWAAAITLSVLPLMAQGYDVNSGAETVLEKAAEARKPAMPRTGLETVEEQLGFFDTLPMDEQKAYLDSVIAALPQLAPTIDAMVDAWAKGDVERLAKLMNESVDGNEKLFKVLLADRNARWADWIKARMDKPGRVFIAVGAGHLAGKDSVQDYLGARGLTAERVTY